MSKLLRVSGFPLGVAHVAKRLNIPERTIRHQAAMGKLPGYRTGKLWRFRPEDIVRLQKEGD